MGIFSRLGEILNANINHLLDESDDPEKTVRQIIYEMEDVLTELKSSAAEVIARRVRLGRRLKDIEQSAREFAEKAELAVAHGRDDLAREALDLKLTCLGQAKSLNGRLEEVVAQVSAYQADISRLEAKLAMARSRREELSLQRRRAAKRHQPREALIRFNSSEILAKLEAVESQIDRLYAEKQVEGFSRGDDLQRKFADLERSERLEDELAALKKKTDENS